MTLDHLTYTDTGTGAPIVLIHGSVDDMRTWSYQTAPFSAHHRLITYSRRYHWPNTGADSATAYRATDHRDDLAALIEELELGPAHLVGASYGAVVALLLAATRPELVRSLVLGEPPAFNFLDRAELEANYRTQILPAKEAYDAGRPIDGVEHFLNSIVGPGAFARFPRGARQVALDNAPEFGLEARSTPEEFFGPLTASDLRSIQTPALLVRGERSPEIFGRVIDVLRSNLPNARYLLVPGASHAMHRHNAPLYNTAVLEFLDAVG
ncbi:MAG TPA: alpha/beta hydrolase [Gemmatimonadaceae bacterium]|nr:alpha/beta hydrolase [Gemmatimonadaceae bacterium]